MAVSQLAGRLDEASGMPRLELVLGLRITTKLSVHLQVGKRSFAELV